VELSSNEINFYASLSSLFSSLIS